MQEAADTAQADLASLAGRLADAERAAAAAQAAEQSARAELAAAVNGSSAQLAEMREAVQQVSRGKGQAAVLTGLWL